MMSDKPAIAHQIGLPCSVEDRDVNGDVRIRTAYRIVYTHWRDGRITRHVEPDDAPYDNLRVVGYQAVHKVDHHTYAQHEAFMTFIARHEYNLPLSDARYTGLIGSRLLTIDELRAKRKLWFQKQARWYEKKGFQDE